MLRRALPSPRFFAAMIVVGTLSVGVACSSGADSSSTTTIADDRATTSTAPSPTDLGATTTTTIGPVQLAVRSTPRGDIVVDGDGMTLYARAPETDESCTATCLDAWPPVRATAIDLDPSLEPLVFALGVETGAADGASDVSPAPSVEGIVEVGGRPLHRFIGDAIPGDTTGQGFNATFFVVTPSGALLRPPPASTTTTTAEPSP